MNESAPRDGRAGAEVAALPAELIVGSGKSYDATRLNMDISDQWHPDILADISDHTLFDKTFKTKRFGEIRLQKGWFNSIIAIDVLEHIPDLVGAMTNCLALLSVGGTMRIHVPYDLSYGAWQDPTHVHAFNERSWLYYGEWCWYLNWTEFRFDLTEWWYQYSEIGNSLVASGLGADEILRMPRAVDEMRVVLRKRALTDDERREGEVFRGESRACSFP